MNRAGVKELAFWDDELVRHGSTIIASRQRFLRELEFSAQRIHAELTDKKETLTLNYIPSSYPPPPHKGNSRLRCSALICTVNLNRAELEPQFHAQLEREREESIQRGMTLTGSASRMTLRLNINGRDVGLYGSRGQARTHRDGVEVSGVSVDDRAKRATPNLVG
jgi:DNA replication and repair protein RecF